MVNAFLLTAIAGGVLAVIVAVRRKRLAATLAGTGRLIAAPGQVQKEITGGNQGEPLRLRAGDCDRQRARGADRMRMRR